MIVSVGHQPAPALLTPQLCHHRRQARNSTTVPVCYRAWPPDRPHLPSCRPRRVRPAGAGQAIGRQTPATTPAPHAHIMSFSMDDWATMDFDAAKSALGGGSFAPQLGDSRQPQPSSWGGGHGGGWGGDGGGDWRRRIEPPPRRVPRAEQPLRQHGGNSGRGGSASHASGSWPAQTQLLGDRPPRLAPATETYPDSFTGKGRFAALRDEPASAPSASVGTGGHGPTQVCVHRRPCDLPATRLLLCQWYNHSAWRGLI
eukprot:SAG25_NODE_1325_length_3287_cov_3.046110_3_plen_257_part_00